MSALKDTITADQTQAMKDRDEIKLSVLRMLSAAIKNEEIAQQGKELSEEAVQEVVVRQAKQLTESIKDFARGGREDLVAKTQGEVDILQTYLPEQMSEEELKNIVQKVLADNDLNEVSQMGQAMGMVMKAVKGQADGNTVKELVSELLAE